jgi:malonyl-CoA O-methyltransferase
MDIRRAYDQWSNLYDSDANKTRDLDQQVIRETLGDLRFGAILETGCGTGKNTAMLAGIGDRVHALDFSTGMLDVARRKVSAPNVRFAAADLTRSWPCPEHDYDLVVCCLVLEHIEHLDAFFSEAARVLRPGGWFYINELHPFRQYHGVQARFRHEDETVLVPAFVHHISDFIRAAEDKSLKLVKIGERWHADDQGGLPRLVSFIFERISILDL